jgi:negative regulator of replication initiation
MKKRIVISVLLLVLVFGILCAGIILIRKNTEKEAKKQTVELAKEQEKISETEEAKKEDASLEDIVFENMNLLENYFSSDEIKSLEEQAENFLRQDEAFASTKKLTCTEETYETQSQIRFYFTTDDGSLLFSVYHKEDKLFSFWTEKKENSETAVADWLKQKEEETKVVDTKSWEEEQYLPSEWTEKGQENIPVVLSGKENLQGIIPEGDLNCLEIKLQKFLEENNELRREISIPSDKIVQTDQEITFEADFITERIDKKHLQGTYHIAEGTFGFSLQ